MGVGGGVRKRIVKTLEDNENRKPHSSTERVLNINENAAGSGKPRFQYSASAESQRKSSFFRNH